MARTSALMSVEAQWYRNVACLPSMNVITVSDLHDTRIAAYRNITDAELVRRRGLFIAEGRLIVERVLADRRCRVESLMMNAASLHALRPVLETRAAEMPVFLCDTAVFAGVTGLNLHRGCLALVRVPSAISWREAVTRQPGRRA